MKNQDYRGGDAKYDTTNLLESGHGKVVHRDYLAHCLRWGWASRQIRWGDKIFDFGCGIESPLYMIIGAMKTFQAPDDPSRMGKRPEYTAVDLNRLKNKRGAVWSDVREQVNIIEDVKTRVSLRNWGEFDIVTSFEVLEHMEEELGDEYLAVAREGMGDNAKLYLSTPVYNGHTMAKNHIREYTILELLDKLHAAGFKVDQRYGTFMSWNDLKRVGTPSELAMAESMRPFLGTEVVACMFAPKYADHSRNNVWICTKA